MKLSEYIKRYGRSRLAKALNTSGSYISQLAHGNRRVTEGKAILIEKATGGEIRCEDLRPDVDWAVIRGTAARNAGTIADE